MDEKVQQMVNGQNFLTALFKHFDQEDETAQFTRPIFILNEIQC